MEDRIYREECKVDVQHVCEEHLAVPLEDEYGPPDPYHHLDKQPVDPHFLPKHEHFSPDLFLPQPPEPHAMSLREAVKKKKRII